MKPKLFAVDGNYYLHRCFFTLRTSRPIEDVLPHNFLGLVLKDACMVKATHVLIAFDGPSVFRYDIYKDYKLARREGKALKKESDEEDVKDIYEYLPHVRKYLSDAGIVWVQKKKHEADDCLSSASAQYDIDIDFGTGDKDVYQSLRKGVRIYNSAPEHPLIIDCAKAEKRKGVPISGMVMYQTLLGDKIDSIPQVLSPVEAKKAVLKWKSFKNWYAKGDEKQKRWLNANQAKLSLNRKLVEMVKDLSLPDIDELKVPKMTLQNMPTAYYAYQELLYPKRKSLFRR